jgi:uncharacterized protein (DUF3084 family)
LTENLSPRIYTRETPVRDTIKDEMDAFTKQVQFLDHTRRYSISVTADGWEVREERDSEVVRQTQYHDWHRVERVQRLIANELNDLQAQGWTVVR